MKKVFSLILTLVLVAVTLCAPAAAASYGETGIGTIPGYEGDVKLGTPIAAYAPEALGYDILANMYAIAAAAGYEFTVPANGNLRWYTRDDSGILRNVIISQKLIFISSLDTNSDYPCGACYCVPMVCANGEGMWDMSTGTNLFI